MIFISYIRTSTGDSFETADLEIEDKEDGSYIVEYSPPHTGLYEVRIEVNGQPLDGSTWSVQVIPHQYHWRKQELLPYLTMKIKEFSCLILMAVTWER